MGHPGQMKLAHPYILPNFEQLIKFIIRKICLSCYKIITRGKKCYQCDLNAPVIKEMKAMKISLIFNG